VALSAALGLCACGGSDDVPAAVEPITASIQSVPTIKELPFDSPTPAACPSTSHPFSSMLCSIGPSLNYDADGTSPVDLKALGYTEKEFLQSGKANVYDLDAPTQRAVLAASGNAYTNRLLVRYPTDAARFSGRVYIEILNASNGYDIENYWRRSWQHLISKGDAFIGITSSPTTAAALKTFDATRYADINWQVAGSGESGLFWDMLSQLGTLLRQADAKVLGTLKPTAVYLTGESGSGVTMNTYIQTFVDKIEKSGPGGKPLFDGYLSGVGSRLTNLRSATATTPASASTPTQIYPATTVPYVSYMGENEMISYVPYTRRADSNSATDKFRLYEFAGAPHADPLSQVLPINKEVLKAAGRARTPVVYYQTQQRDDLQFTEFIHAMQENLHDWSSKGIPPPTADANWMWNTSSTNASGVAQLTPMRDQFGNALGGIRSPLIAAPLYRIYAQGQSGPTSFTSFNWGSMDKLTDSTINALYSGSCSNYLARFNSAADALVQGRYLLKAEAENLKTLAKTKGSLVSWTDTKPCT
jgi:hypothetical protein